METHDLFGDLAAHLGDRFSRSSTIREQHRGLEGHHAAAPPDAVVFAETEAHVVEVVRWCNLHRVPLIAHGAGTSLEGHLSAIKGGLSLDLSRMNNIVEVSADNLLCTVQAGITREALNYHLKEFGLFFPIDPGANAALGGMAATRASGTNAVRYGTMRDNVLSLKIVLADGSVIETGRRASKSSAGYDLTALFVGSEGTLGVITEVTLRLYGIPETILAGTCSFPDVDRAARAVIYAIQVGVPVARIELLDEFQIAACNAFSRLNLPERPTLFLEFHGSAESVREQAQQFNAIATEEGGGDFAIAAEAEDRSRLWKARHNAYFATKALQLNARIWTTDVCVPIAHLAESIAATRADIEKSGARATIVGHVGDGNYHVLFVLDPARPEDQEKAATINERMVERAIACGGTCTGEHGIGLGKRESLIRERGETAVALMRTLKQALDPNDILNPGKIFF